MPRLALLAATLTLAGVTTLAQTPDTTFLEELTWTEVRDAIQSGTTTVIIPTAGTEQKGPHMVLGQHRFVVNHAANLIARRLGDELVAPVITHVPEGGLDPPSGHMRYAGTVTLPNEFFMKIVEYSARSLAVHGFTDIVLIGDSGGNQDGLQQVSELLNDEWATRPDPRLFRGGLLLQQRISSMAREPGGDRRHHWQARRHQRHLAVAPRGARTHPE